MRILIVEDDDAYAATLARTLARREHETQIASGPAAALEAMRHAYFDAAIVDLRLADQSGLTLIEPLLARNPRLRILMLTGYASIATAIDAIKRGAYDYLPKPATARQILAALAPPTSGAPPEIGEPASPRRLEWEHIQRVLADHDYNVSATARALGMYRRTLQRKLTKKPVAE